MDGPPYEAAVRIHQIAEVNWPSLVARYSQQSLLDETPARFCDLVHGWAREVIRERIIWGGAKAEDMDQFEESLTLPLEQAWRKELKPSKSSLQADKEAFLALTQSQTH